MAIMTRKMTTPVVSNRTSSGPRGKGVRGTAVYVGEPSDQAYVVLRKALADMRPERSSAIEAESLEISEIDYTNGIGFARGTARVLSIDMDSSSMHPPEAVSFLVRWVDGVDPSGLPSPTLTEYELS